MPRCIKVRDKNNGVYSVISTLEDEVLKQDPVLFFGAYLFFQYTQLLGMPEEEARKESIRQLIEWRSSPCPPFLVALCDTTQKREQERLLRGQQVTPENLITWILLCGAKGGKISQYGYNGGSGDLAGRAPLLIDASDSQNIKTVGETNLSDSALKHLVEVQNRLLVQFVDFDDGRWYCFYRTLRGLAGREQGNHGQHMHFISSAFGVNRDVLIENFKRGVCPGNGFHVRLASYHEEDVRESSADTAEDNR